MQILVFLVFSCESSEKLNDSEACPDGLNGIDIDGINTNKIDSKSNPSRLLVLMGGSAENDSAAMHFVEAANGGDIVALRVTGSLTSYPEYFMNELNVNLKPSKVTTIRSTNPELTNHESVLCRVNQAEAIWLAGGDQWNYVGRWSAKLHNLLDKTSQSNISIAGTSAGSVSLGEAVFDAKNGSITSAEALLNPFHSKLSLSYNTFSQPELNKMIVDSHYKNRDREGRLLAFLARFKFEKNHDSVYGIGLDEKTAIVIENNHFKVYSDGNGFVWIYELSGSVSISENIPLTLSNIKRIKLSNAASSEWPIRFSDYQSESISVSNGVIQ